MLIFRHTTQQTAPADGPAAAPAVASPLPTGRKRRIPTRKRILVFAAALAAAAAVGIGLFQIFFSGEEQILVTGTATYGSLNRAIEGSGTTVPANSQIISPASSTAEILEVFVSPGDEVAVGDPLYRQDASELNEQIQELEDQLQEYKTQLEDYYDQREELQENLASLTVTASFAGHITDVQVEEGDSVNEGAKLANLTDDSTFTVTQYFSYAYEDDIYVGMPATVSVADQMLNLSGKVTEVRMVERVTSEGLKCFAVTVSVANPGSLTDGMSASCWLTGSGGESIYPSITGTLTCRSVTITSEVSGTLSDVRVDDYDSVSKGETLFRIESSTYEKQLKNINNQISYLEERIAAQEESIADTEEKRSDYEVCAEIAGQVISVGVEAGSAPGTVNTAVAIYDLTSMSIQVNIDELDVDQLETGMDVVVTRSTSSGEAEVYTGTLTELALEATSSNGVATFPATITIDSDGELSAGVNVSYSISVGDTEEGILVPVDALRTTDDGYCVIVEADSRPDNAVDLEDADIPDGYYAVSVEVGSSNSQYVRILSGAEEGDTLFLRYQNSAPSGGENASEGAEQNQNGQMPDFSGGQMPDFSGGGMPDFSGGGMPAGGGPSGQ